MGRGRTEAEVNTLASPGLHAMSSTDPVCEREGVGLTAQAPPSPRCHSRMSASLSPVASRNGAAADHASAYPSVLCLYVKPGACLAGAAGAVPLPGPGSASTCATCGAKSHRCTCPVSEKLATSVGRWGHDCSPAVSPPPPPRPPPRTHRHSVHAAHVRHLRMPHLHAAALVVVLFIAALLLLAAHPRHVRQLHHRQLRHRGAHQPPPPPPPPP